MQSADCGIKAI